MKSDDITIINRHAFEVAGLGKAPFRFVGMSEKVHPNGDGTVKAGGTCSYCGTGIRFLCHIVSSDGKSAAVGTNCINKVGDNGLIKAYKSSQTFRAHQRALRAEKAKAVFNELTEILNANRSTLENQPHPMGFIDRATGRALTAWDDAQWYLSRCGDAGKARWLKTLRVKYAVAA